MRDRALLTAMVAALGMLTIDVTAVRVALPAIQVELGATDVEQAWVINGYLLSLGVLVIAGGRAGDLFGRRRVFLAGLAIFTVCSALAGLAPSGGFLVAARIVQGAGAAIMTPGVYAMITDGFAGRNLGRAMGTLTGTAAVGLSLGPLLGGLLVDVASWRFIFFLNLPVAIFTAVAVLRAVRAGRPSGGPRIDVAGLVLLAVGLTAVDVGLLQAGPNGWTAPSTLALLLVGLAGLAAFWAVESRVRDPLVDPVVVRQPNLTAANVVGFCMQFVSTAVTVLVAIWLQEGLGASALLAGLALLPMTLPLTVASPLAGRFVPRLGARRLVIAGTVTVAVGTAGIGAGALSGTYPAVVPGLILFGCGFAVVLTALTTALMAAAGALDRGMVSGIYNTARNVGASVGVGVTNSLLLGLAVSRSLDQAFAVTMFVTAGVAAVGAGAAFGLARPAAASVGDQVARGHDQIPRHV